MIVITKKNTSVRFGEQFAASDAQPTGPRHLKNRNYQPECVVLTLWGYCNVFCLKIRPRGFKF